MFGCGIVTYDIIMVYVCNMYISGYCLCFFWVLPDASVRVNDS